MARFQSTAQIITTLFSVTRLMLALTAFTDPSSYATVVGFPPPPPPNGFIPFSAARNIGLDLVILIFSYQGEWRHVSTVLFCTVPVALLDAAVTWRFATQRSKAWVHVLGTCGIACLAWALKKGR